MLWLMMAMTTLLAVTLKVRDHPFCFLISQIYFPVFNFMWLKYHSLWLQWLTSRSQTSRKPLITRDSESWLRTWWRYDPWSITGFCSAAVAYFSFFSQKDIDIDAKPLFTGSPDAVLTVLLDNVVNQKSTISRLINMILLCLIVVD